MLIMKLEAHTPATLDLLAKGAPGSRDIIGYFIQHFNPGADGGPKFVQVLQKFFAGVLNSNHHS